MGSMKIRDQLLAEIDAFLARHPEIAESTLGFKAVNSGKVIGELRAGGNITIGTADRLREYMRGYGGGSGRKSPPLQPAA